MKKLKAHEAVQLRTVQAPPAGSRTVPAAASDWDVNVSTVRGWIRTGRTRAVQVLEARGKAIYVTDRDRPDPLVPPEVRRPRVPKAVS